MKRRHWDGLPALVEDILETETGRWFTVENIIDTVLLYRPDVDTESARRAVERVLVAPRIPIRRRWSAGAHGIARRQLMCPERVYLQAG